MASTLWEVVAECAESLNEPFTKAEMVSWCRRHYPDVLESSFSVHVQAATVNSPNRDRSAYANRTPLLERLDRGLYRRYTGDPLELKPTGPTVSPTKGTRAPAELTHAQEEWTWEGQIQAVVVAHLASSGVAITRVADTASRERGTDIEGTEDGRLVLVEVKGWPSAVYARGEHQGKPKPTQPTVQARVWFADGLLKVLSLREANPGDRVVLALPDIPRYRNLLASVRSAFDRADIEVLFADEQGNVRQG